MIALLIVIGFIAIVFAVPAPEPQKAPEPKPEPKPAVINVYRTSHVHKHVVIKVQMLVVPAGTVKAAADALPDAPSVLKPRALERYQPQLELPAPRTKIEA